MKKKLYKYLILCCFTAILTPFAIVGQTKEKVIKISQVKGEYRMTDNSRISLAEAYEWALLDAKKEAIRKAGFGEYVSQWEQLQTTSAGQSYNSLSTTDLKGEIIDYKVIKKEISYDTDHREIMICNCTINASVKEVAKADPNFTAEISNINATYFPNDKLTFTVTPYQNCYLKVFLLESLEKGYLMYPNEYEKVKLLPANTPLTIPQNIDFVIEKNNNEPTESNFLVFLFTKEERPAFYDNLERSRKEIESWISKIPNDEKFIIYVPIEIREN